MYCIRFFGKQGEGRGGEGRGGEGRGGEGRRGGGGEIVNLFFGLVGGGFRFDLV